MDRSIKPTTKPKPGAICTWHASSTQFLPISFKPLLKHLRRGPLVNFGEILQRKRVGHTQNIGINGLQGQHLAGLQFMNYIAWAIDYGRFNELTLSAQAIAGEIIGFGGLALSIQPQAKRSGEAR